MNKSVFGKTLENIRNRVHIRLISSDNVAKKLAAKPSYDRCTIFDETSLPFTWRRQSFILISQSILVWAFLIWVKSWCMTFIITVLRPSMEIMQNYSSPTPTLSHMKLQPTIFTKISTPTLRNGLTLVTTQRIIHLELKQD